MGVDFTTKVQANYKEGRQEAEHGGEARPEVYKSNLRRLQMNESPNHDEIKAVRKCSLSFGMGLTEK